MNGKIKTKFAALFAVALMITVCVVPMVGNDYGEAATETEYIPSSGYEFSSATVSGVVLDKNGTGINGAEVTVSGLTSGTTLLDDVTVYTNSSGAYTAQVQWPTAVDSSSPINLTVKLTVTEKLNDGETVNPAYGLFSSNTLSFIGVTDGYTITGADFKAGYYVIPGQIYYENGVNSSGAGINGGEVKESASLTLNKNGSPIDGASIVVDSATGAFNVYIPSSLSLSTGDKLTITGTDYESAELTSIPSSFVVKKTGTYLAVISVGAVVDDDSLTIEPSPATGNTSAIGTITTSATINADDVKPIQIVYTLSSDASATDYTVKLTSSAGYGDLTLTLDKAKINYSGISYNQTNYVTGNVSMKVDNNVINAARGGTIVLKFYEEEDCENQVGSALGGSTTKIYIEEDGNYLVPYGNGYANAKYVKVEYNAAGGSDLDGDNVVEFEDGEACTASVSVDSTGYNLVYGKVLNERGQGIEGVSIEINDEDAFGITMPSTPSTGSIYTVTTDDEGNYAVFTGKDNVTIKPSAISGVSFDIASVQKEVNGAVSQNFVMKDKVIKITVNDAAETPAVKMQGVTVKYAIVNTSTTPGNGDYTAIASKTNAEGVVELVLNGNALVGKDLYLKADYAGRTFVAADDVSGDCTIDTSDKKYPVNFVSNTSSSVPVDITGLTLPTIVKATVSNVPSTGTAQYVKYETETFGALTLVDSKKGEAYFYGPASFDDLYLDFGAETFGKYYVSEYTLLSADAENVCSVVVSEYFAEGTVTDKGGNKIPGANVTVYKGDVAIGNGITNSVGYFKFPTTQSLTGAIVKIGDIGYYTFEESYAYSSAVFKAVEEIATGNIAEADGTTPIYNADVTVTSKAVENGQAYTSKVRADGTFDYLLKVTGSGANTEYASFVSAVDSTGVYTFKNVEVDDNVNFVYKAKEQTYEFTVNQSNSEPAVGISVDLYKSVNNQAPVLVKSGLVTDENGQVKAVLTEGTYLALAKSVENGLQFADTPDSTPIEASNKYIELTLTSKNNKVCDGAEYVVTSYKVGVADKTKVGQATAVDGKVNIVTVDDAVYTVSSSEGALYTFGSESEPYVAPTGSKNNVIKANESVYKAQVTSKAITGVPVTGLEGITVTLKDKDDKVVGTGVTDKDGYYEIVANEAKKAFAADAELAIGKFTFTTEPTDVGTSIAADEALYFGYYANGAVVKDVEVSYMDDDVKSFAKVIDNKYYIVTESDLTGVKVTATAPNFNAVGTITAANAPLTVGDVPTYDAYFMPSMGAQILGPYNDVVYGTVLTLVAQNEYSIGVPEEDGVIQKYKFAGWYVNGEKVSDDLVTTYTVNGDCTIYADYKVSSYVAAPADESNGLSMDVLILGIVIVVLGLLAFAYAVKFKKE